MKGNMYIGTAGWTYDDWNGLVYPQPKPRGFDEILFLSNLVNLLEINTTFYRIPHLGLTRSWTHRAESLDDFLFNVKLYRGFTHERDARDPSQVHAFSRALEPMVEALPGKALGLLVLGGIFYTGGIVFYALDTRVRHAHGIWHLFVLAGSISHFMAMFLYVL